MKSGSETIHITGAGQLPYALEKEKKLNEALNRLSSEGKRVINTIDGPQSVAPLGILIGSVTILWEKDDEQKAVTPAIIQNVAPTNEPKRNIIINENNISASILRANMFLQDQDWSTAMDYFNGILDIDPTNADAYIGCFCAEQKIKEIDKLAYMQTYMSDNRYIRKALSFSNNEQKEKIERLLQKNNEAIQARIKSEREKAQREQQQKEAERKRLEEKRKTERNRLAEENKDKIAELENEIRKYEKELDEVIRTGKPKINVKFVVLYWNFVIVCFAIAIVCFSTGFSIFLGIIIILGELFSLLFGIPLSKGTTAEEYRNIIASKRKAIEDLKRPNF